MVYDRVASRLSELDPPRFVAKFSLDADPVMAERFSDKKPHFLYYDESQVSSYDGDRSEEGIFSFIKDATTSKSELVSAKFLNSEARKSELMMAYVGPENAQLY